MKILSILFLSFLISGNSWVLDFQQAENQAKESHKLILISFSGSDWCGPCIRTHKEIFEKQAFIDYADKNLVLVKADFPRLKKNQLPEDQLKKNNELAVKYNPEGDFPLTVLTDEEGKVIKEWKGFPDCSSDEFVKKIQDAAH
ncbi:thioredoxin family protein [Pedobacter sp. SD-b]|uniref:Thioredoxin family protein n=1 Tax=Pedobacter segetis TaxID=2793069 RepID=A0ABS1BEW0_9SPHI|nr:thioredoxin family protein [Pedobacter segetis]MBK0381336.1 thioredoxin family protein [Pedobacter segetis]